MNGISILNYNLKEKVHHKLVLVKCHLHKSSKNDLVQVVCNNIEEKFKIDRFGVAKILLQLQDGVNQIQICSSSVKVPTKLVLNYENRKIRLKVQGLYVLCSDEHLPSQDLENNLKKLCLALQLIQCLFSEKLLESTGIRKTFNLANDCKVFHIKFTIEEVHNMNQVELWTELAKELVTSSIWDENTKYVAFMACTKYLGVENGDYSYANIKKHTLTNPALSTGGLALLGTGCLYTWPITFEQILPCFNNKQLVDMKHQLDDSNYRRTFGGCFASTLGSVAHELGHLFDLGHTPDGIMGNGLDYLNRVFCCDLTTDDLPDREVVNLFSHKSCQVNDLKKLRFTKIQQPGQFLVKYHEQKTGDDLTHFLPNNSLTLFYHKWFNEDQRVKNSREHLNYSHDSSIIYSSSPLVLVELRREGDEMLQHYETFLDENIFEHKITEHTMAGLLFVMNQTGNTLKVKLK